jgi:signal recognition particle subunit SRP54
MGDVLTLIEKANETINEDDQANITKKLMEGNFTLQDFAEQLSMIDRMGSLQKIAHYLPGMGNVPTDAMEKGQGEMKKFKAIIGSMNKKERLVPNILDASRKKRIASGSGTDVQDVNQLLQRFDQSKQFVKMFKKMGKFKGFFK